MATTRAKHDALVEIMAQISVDVPGYHLRAKQKADAPILPQKVQGHRLNTKHWPKLIFTICFALQFGHQTCR